MTASERLRAQVALVGDGSAESVQISALIPIVEALPQIVAVVEAAESVARGTSADNSAVTYRRILREALDPLDEALT